MNDALTLGIHRQELAFKTPYMSCYISLHDGLLLLADLDTQLGIDKKSTDVALQGVYRQLLLSLFLLPAKTQQLLFRNASDEALACLLRMFKASDIERQLLNCISARRAQVAREDPLFAGLEMPSKEDLRTWLAPFFDFLMNEVHQGKIKLLDPKGVYY
ncbi:hypothetical protein SAMN05421831_11722 [Allopseudospirillum japonicum]|uniref:Uncharacterized protein n=1 Tax=Allopseudospirillum japonicum TaxID=64971 RepID=A0A1H6UK74_9GAMM|nr:hypothetical protein [Allopseudospirillum japonicum]SEI91084.1 hypothetical protein SAMN05421831_11722 [Allopseudospirillum japonicum]